MNPLYDAYSFSLISSLLLRNSVLIFIRNSAAGVVLCGGRKKTPPTSSIVWFIFSLQSFQIGECILRNQKLVIRLDPFSQILTSSRLPF